MKKNIYKTGQVFVPGGMPHHTYVSRSERNLEKRLRSAADNLCKLITVTGATKSGKTVLTNKIFPKTNNIWVDGGSVGEENDLWNYILEGLDGYTNFESIASEDSESTFKSNIEGEVSIPLVAKGKTNFGTEHSKRKNIGRNQSISLTPRAAAISQLRRKRIPRAYNSRAQTSYF